MLAVVDIYGQQFKVSEKETYYVPSFDGEPNSDVVFDSVLMASDETGTKIGTPYLSDVKVYATVLEHLRDDKILIFKKKRRIGYRKLNGHRQHLTKILVNKIGK